MQASSATVTALSSDIATVAVRRSDVCARCALGKGCGAGLLYTGDGIVEMTLPQPATGTLAVGDEVQIGLEPVNLLRAALLAYGLPMAGTVLALLLAALWPGTLNDAEAVVVALLGLGAGLVEGRRRLRRARCLEQFVPRIIVPAGLQRRDPHAR
jgi:sigma-E factor negative regulatory protein RseC